MTAARITQTSSQVPERPHGLLLVCLTHQEVEPSRPGVGFDLLVPLLPVFFRQLPEELGEFLTGESLDFCLEFVYL